eukprot:765094-Hanusia_phi.AAC.4
MEEARRRVTEEATHAGEDAEDDGFQPAAEGLEDEGEATGKRPGTVGRRCVQGAGSCRHIEYGCSVSSRAEAILRSLLLRLAQGKPDPKP